MKHIPLLALLLSSPAIAGTEVVPVPMPPPAEPSLWTWFAGGSVGYLVDYEEEMYHAHVGAELHKGAYSHGFFLEVGYTEEDERWYEPQWREDWSADMEIMPITLNYKLEGPLADNFRWYVGAGLGVAIADLDYKWRRRDFAGTSGQGGDDDTVFAAQAFAGLIWEVNDSFEVYGGVRYIYLDGPEFKFDGATVEWDDEIDDTLIELGARFNF